MRLKTRTDIQELKDILESIVKFDDTEELEKKGKFFEIIQKDARSLVENLNLHSVVQLSEPCKHPRNEIEYVGE